MSDIIQLLPDSVANQIAAGEVIQRPASVVKELMENAVDAGAKNINVVIVDAGRTLIQVIDDGKGMSETDARLAFERHSTSKIRKADDLFSLHTMGFRGEALASIVSVAQVELKTRQATDDLGTHLMFEGSKFLSQEPCSCAQGCNFQVKNLFFNVPARRKFLKSNSTELNNIISVFERIALVYPEIAFTLHSNDSEIFNLRADNIRQRIVEIFGKKINQDLLPVETDTTMVKISGFIGKPESAKKKGLHQFFFVNGRFMKHPYFHRAVMNAYERLIPAGEQVSYFIYMTVPAENIDVNIHPTKTEIKFENEQAIWQILSAVVREAVGLFNDVPTIDFDTQERPDIPVFGGQSSSGSFKQPMVDVNPNYNPFNETPSSFGGGSVQGWEQLYDDISQDNTQPEETLLFPSKATAKTTSDDIINEKSPLHYQYKGKYIMTAVKSGLMIISQHRASVRIMYERYMAKLADHKLVSQKIMFPELVELSSSEQLLFERILPSLQEMGFELSPMGQGSYAINAIPAGVEGVKASDLINDMLASAANEEISNDDVIKRMLVETLATNAAIPEGQVLNNEEMENIVNELFLCENAKRTPDGKQIVTIFNQNDIERLFSA